MTENISNFGGQRASKISFAVQYMLHPVPKSARDSALERRFSLLFAGFIGAYHRSDR